MQQTEYSVFFQEITGNMPFPYQQRLGETGWPDLLDIPTGLGKTAAVIVSWINKRLHRDQDTPRRLIYCLPMRVLVDQTYQHACNWLNKAEPYYTATAQPLPSVFLLMGGDQELSWTEEPERSAIIIGTQDMLLSAALMRGYGLSRYRWPIHFGLLHNDALWVFDEIQLMGAGLTTSIQLEALRRRIGVSRLSRSLWVSATLNPNWLDTADMEPFLPLNCSELDQHEQSGAQVRRRIEAEKRLHQARFSLTLDNHKQGAKDYIQALADFILEQHQPQTNTIIILNTVERAQNLFLALEKTAPAAKLLLIHARFRPAERRELNRLISEPPPPQGQIFIATQAVEAGVDITSRILCSELAPWSSLVQRFGRCNRYGECCGESGGADIFWIDIQSESKLASPYSLEALEHSRNKLLLLDSASPAHLPRTDEPIPVFPTLREKDLRELFNTDPDLSGFDLDISVYIRDAGVPDIQVFWRDLSQDFRRQPPPIRDELCRTSITQIKQYFERIRKNKGAVYRWDSLSGEWRRCFENEIRPGLILMLAADQGGYTEKLGFSPKSAAPAPLLKDSISLPEIEQYGGDWRSQASSAVELTQHLNHVMEEAATLCQALNEPLTDLVVQAAGWHDAGKSHPVFQAAMHNCPSDSSDQFQPLLAKSAARAARYSRRLFRHELASMLCWLEQQSQNPHADLIAYLILAHHGKVRLSLRAMSDEQEPVLPLGPRFARGIWEGDILPEFNIPLFGLSSKICLRLDLMELGQGNMGSSWTSRVQQLLANYGPFRLAWLESLTRIADWRASQTEQEILS